MNLGWILLGLVGWALGLVVVLALFRMASDQDRAARHVQKRLDPYSDVTITRAGDACQSGGRCEIRTHGAVADTPDFKSGALDRSANLPEPVVALISRPTVPS